MKKRQITPFSKYCIVFFIILLSCNKEFEVDDNSITVEVGNVMVQEAIEKEKIYIAEVLSESVQDVDVRAFLKKEALLKFNKEYDVLIQLVLEKEVRKGETFLNILKKYDKPGHDIETSLKNQPLLTIYVPQLPQFSPLTWDAVNDEAPYISVYFEKGHHIKYFGANSINFQMTVDHIPAFPVLVLKENERIVLESQKNEVKNGRIKYHGNKNISFSFIHDEDADEMNSARIANYTSFDPKIREAYEKCKTASGTYHKDYIYYSIFPPEGRNEGSGDWQYEEAIIDMRFDNIAGVEGISRNYTEGTLELVFTYIFIGGDNKIPTPPQQVVYVNQSDLFTINYENKCIKLCADPFKILCRTVCFDVEVSRTPKTYTFPNPLFIAPFDLVKYGDRWLIHIIERDPSETFEQEFQHSTTKGSNWKFDASSDKIIKIGAGFGGSETYSTSDKTKVTFTRASDQLGHFIFDYFAPVIVRDTKLLSTKRGYGYKKTSGTVTFSIETMKRY